MEFSFLLLTVLSVIRSVRSDSATCYFPDHTPAADFYACNENATYSACCRASEVCISNGYCLQQAGLANRISRGACTDSAFDANACPSQCMDGECTARRHQYQADILSVSTDASLSIFLAYDSEPNGAFCCAASYNISSSRCLNATNGSYEPFSLPSGNVIWNRKYGSTLSANQTQALGASTATATSTQTVFRNSDSDDDSNIAAISTGAVLGVLLIVSLVVCGILFMQLRKAKRQIANNWMAINGSSRHAEATKTNYSPSSRPGYGGSMSTTDGPYHGYRMQPSPPGHYMQAQTQQPVEVPSQFIAEAPTEQEVHLADSRDVYKRV